MENKARNMECKYGKEESMLYIGLSGQGEKGDKQ